MKTELLYTVETANTLGEGVLWDDRQKAFWWTDIEGRTLHRLIWASKKHDIFPTPERLTAFGFTEDDGLWIVAFESGFAFYRPESGEVSWIAKPFKNTKGLRFNDGRVDAEGRFWCGTMAEDGKPATIIEGTLYCLDADLKVSEHLSSIHISNSICWSPDGTAMYFADSPTQRIRRFGFDMKSGIISKVRTFARTESHAYPDGSITDSQGYLWNAQWAAGQVVRYAPDGSVDFVLAVPASQPTCVAFGGPNLDLLCVTSATQGLSDDARANDPKAGHLFIYQIETKGIKAARFRGKKIAK